MCKNKKLPVYVHMTHVVKIDIITGHEEKSNMHFIFWIIFFIAYLSKNHAVLKKITVNYESITYCLTKFCYSVYF